MAANSPAICSKDGFNSSDISGTPDRVRAMDGTVTPAMPLLITTGAARADV